MANTQFVCFWNKKRKVEDLRSSIARFENRLNNTSILDLQERIILKNCIASIKKDLAIAEKELIAIEVMEPYHVKDIQNSIIKKMIGQPTCRKSIRLEDDDGKPYTLFGNVDYSTGTYTYNNKKYVYPKGNHAYTVAGLDGDEVILINPWYSNTEVRVPKAIFLNYFELSYRVYDDGNFILDYNPILRNGGFDQPSILPTL